PSRADPSRGPSRIDQLAEIDALSSLGQAFAEAGSEERRAGAQRPGDKRNSDRRELIHHAVPRGSTNWPRSMRSALSVRHSPRLTKRNGVLTRSAPATSAIATVAS